jgi:DNA-binding SARP family transcriptional activator
MNRLEIFLLGSFKVLYDGNDLTNALRTRKERALLAYLAEESAQPHPREAIAEFFWPDRPENYARMNLRQALLGLRKAFNAGEETTLPIIQITEETAQAVSRNIRLDTHTFYNHIQFTKSHPHEHLHTCQECIHHLEGATELYRGDFLDGFILGDLVSFQEWIVFHRERYFRTMLDTLHTLSKIYGLLTNYDQAYKYAWRYAYLAPLEETAHRLLMRILTLSGRRNAALQQYQLCKTLIEKELGVEPSNETQQLYTYIKNGLPIQDLETGQLVNPKNGLRQPRQPDPSAPLYDPATQLPLRPLLMDRLKHAITRMERAHLMLIVFLVSVTYPQNLEMPADLKKQVVQHFVRRLVGSVREGDTVAILREDEYAMVLEEIKDPAVVEAIAQKINRVGTAPILAQGQRIDVKLVIGASLYPVDGADAQALLNQADFAMRTARLQQSSFYFPPPSS